MTIGGYDEADATKECIFHSYQADLLMGREVQKPMPILKTTFDN
jgi:hypothetical protein